MAEGPMSNSTPSFLPIRSPPSAGEPTTTPEPVPANTNKEMLEAILAAEKQATIDYSQRAEEADALETRPVVQLEDMVRDESGHAFEETERILCGWFPRDLTQFDSRKKGAKGARALTRNGT